MSSANYEVQIHSPLSVEKHHTAINFQETDLLDRSSENGDPLPPSMQTCTRMVRRSNARTLVKHSGIRISSNLGFLKDGFTTLLNARWYWIIIFFCANYVLSWLVFGGIWLAVAVRDTEDKCLVNVNDFNSAFLFAVETQVTIGYGTRYVKGDCSGGIFLIMLQSIIGLFQDSVLLGLVFVKLTRPRNRRKTILFSDVAVINERDSQRCLDIRIGDIRRTQVVECHVRVMLYWNRLVDRANNQYEFQNHELEVGYSSGRDRLLLLTPVVVTHAIDEASPLFGITEEELAGMDVEVVVILEGIVEATGLTVQALWSYTRSEIVFGHKFLPMVRRRKGQWEIDFSLLSSTIAQ